MNYRQIYARKAEGGIHTEKFWDEPMTATEKERKKWHEIAEAAWNRRADNG